MVTKDRKIISFKDDFGRRSGTDRRRVSISASKEERVNKDRRSGSDRRCGSERRSGHDRRDFMFTSSMRNHNQRY